MNIYIVILSDYKNLIVLFLFSGLRVALHRAM